MSITQTDELVYKYELKIHQLEMDRIYEEELFANSYLSPSHKIIFLTIRRIIRNLRIDDSTPTVIHLAELVNKTAISEPQIKRLLKELDQWGMITKTTTKIRKGSTWESEMKISIGGTIKPKDIVTDHKRPGGDQRCHVCGSKNIEPSVYMCKDCGHYGHYD